MTGLELWANYKINYLLFELYQMLAEQGTHISAYVQDTLLAWVRLYPSQQQVSQLGQICNGQFFLCLLQTLPHFKLLSPICQAGGQNSLASKVTTMKAITKSLIHYHQSQLLRDVSELSINYVQLCMGNRKELFRLVTIVLSALCSQSSSRAALQEQISKLPQDKYQIIKIMIDNSVNLGQECGSCSSRSWRLSEQKKVIAKMEVLENKIEELEILNRGLEEAIKANKQTYQFSQQENRKIKEQMRKLVVLNEELMESNDKALNQLKIANIDAAGSTKKFQVVKSKMQQRINTLETELNKLMRDSQQNHSLKDQILKITQINKEIREQNQILRQNLSKCEEERTELKNLQKIHNEKFISLKQHCSELEIKIQQLQLVCSSKSNQGEGSTKTCYFGVQGEIQDEINENCYRIRDDLGWLKEESKAEQGQVIKQGMKASQFEIRTITERSLEDSMCLDNLKQNQSIFINNSQLAIDNGSFLKPKSPGIEASLDLRRSEQYRALQRQFVEQIKVLTCVILDLQVQLQEANKRNPIVYREGDSVSASRMQRFKVKVKEMFNKSNNVR